MRGTTILILVGYMYVFSLNYLFPDCMEKNILQSNKIILVKFKEKISDFLAHHRPGELLSWISVRPLAFHI